MWSCGSLLTRWSCIAAFTITMSDTFMCLDAIAAGCCYPVVPLEVVLNRIERAYPYLREGGLSWFWACVWNPSGRDSDTYPLVTTFGSKMCL